MQHRLAESACGRVSSEFSLLLSRAAAFAGIAVYVGMSALLVRAALLLHTAVSDFSLKAVSVVPLYNFLSRRACCALAPASGYSVPILQLTQAGQRN